jgi:chromosome segregation ATPase
MAKRIKAYEEELGRVQLMTKGINDYLASVNEDHEKKIDSLVVEYNKKREEMRLAIEELNKKIAEIQEQSNALFDQYRTKEITLGDNAQKQQAEFISQKKLALGARKFFRQHVLDEIAKIDEDINQGISVLGTDCHRLASKQKELNDQLKVVQDDIQAIDVEWKEICDLVTKL